MNLRWLY